MKKAEWVFLLVILIGVSCVFFISKALEKREFQSLEGSFSKLGKKLYSTVTGHGHSKNSEE